MPTEEIKPFEEWWSKQGRFIDPDTEDVPWFDKRKELCAYAFSAGAAYAIKVAREEARKNKTK